MSEHTVQLTINGKACSATVEGRTTLADMLRKNLGMTGTHIGCEHGVCGACTVRVDGRSARSCLMLAAQTDGFHVDTIEGLAGANGTLNVLQKAIIEHHGVQCGFCTPGVLMTLMEMLETVADPDEDTVRDWLSGNICRCTGYQGIVDAALAAAKTIAGQKL